jgi:hypothetical protein
MAEASGSRTHRRQETCRPPVLKITQTVLSGSEKFLFYLTVQGLPETALQRVLVQIAAF